MTTTLAKLTDPEFNVGDAVLTHRHGERGTFTHRAVVREIRAFDYVIEYVEQGSRPWDYNLVGRFPADLRRA